MNAAKGTRVAIYARVSTTDQHTDNQLTALREAAERAGWLITGVYSDNGVSGSKGREARPEYDRMLTDAKAGKFDMIAAWSVDRLSRSLSELARLLDYIHRRGINLYLEKQRLDTTDAYGKAMFQMAGVFAELERELIRMRTKEGLKRARDAGRVGGRRPVSEAKEARVRELLDDGAGIKATAKAAGVGVSVVYRIKREMEDERPPVTL